MRLSRDDCRNENGRVKEEIHFKGDFLIAIWRRRRPAAGGGVWRCLSASTFALLKHVKGKLLFVRERKLSSEAGVIRI